jgi:leucyl aminopeptidase (aminopeptidase T)
MNRLEKAAQLALFEALEVQAKQTLLLVATPKLSLPAQIFRKVAEKAHVEVFYLEVPNTPNKRSWLSPLSRQFLNSVAQVVLLAPHLDADSLNWLRQQTASRVIIWPQLEEDTIQRCASTDFRRLRERCRKLADILTIGRSLKLRLASGAEMEMSIMQRRGSIEAAPLNGGEFFCSLPAGRAFVVPQVSSINGEILLHAVAGEASHRTQPIQIKVLDGRLKLIKGGKTSNDLRRRLRAKVEGTESSSSAKSGTGRHIVEIGFGMNENARLGQSEMEDEKVQGTVHLGFGRRGTGGKPHEVLARGIIMNPTIIIDGREIIREGKMMFD